MNIHTYLENEISELMVSRCKSEGISIAAYLRRLVLQDLKRPQMEKLKPAEELLAFLNRKGRHLIGKAFYSTPNNLAAVERIREKYKPDVIRKAVEAAIAKNYTRDQLKPDALFLPENFEKLLEEKREPVKKISKGAPKKTPPPASAHQGDLFNKQYDIRKDPMYGLLKKEDYPVLETLEKQG